MDCCKDEIYQLFLKLTNPDYPTFDDGIPEFLKTELNWSKEQILEAYRFLGRTGEVLILEGTLEEVTNLSKKCFQNKIYSKVHSTKLMK